MLGFRTCIPRPTYTAPLWRGLNYALREGLETLCRRAKCQVDYLTVSGGGAVNDLICQITADMFGKTVKRAQTHETAGLGSSIAGFVGMGEFSSLPEAVGEMVRHTSVFQPTLEGFQIYDELYREVYRESIPKCGLSIRKFARFIGNMEIRKGPIRQEGWAFFGKRSVGKCTAGSRETVVKKI